LLHSFDPNTTSADDWKKFGVSTHAIRAILNYRSKGGIFHSPSDLKKIYGLNEADYNRLLPFIAIGDSFKLKEEVSSKIQNKNNVSILEINTADSIAWVALPGIGPVTAQKILDYRQEHGSFHSVAELEGVPGIGPGRLAQLKGLVIP